MNRNRIKALMVLAIPAILATSQPGAWAEPGQGSAMGGQPGSRPSPEARHQMMMQQMGLTSEQAEKMKALREQGKAQSQALQQQLKTKRQAMMQYMQSPDATEAQARRMHNELNDLQRQMGEQRIKSWFQMRTFLTPEQMQKMQQMRQQRMQHGGGMRGKSGGKQGGPGGRRGSGMQGPGGGQDNEIPGV